MIFTPLKCVTFATTSLNNRPRKALLFETPIEVFDRLVAKAQSHSNTPDPASFLPLAFDETGPNGFPSESIGLRQKRKAGESLLLEEWKKTVAIH